MDDVDDTESLCESQLLSPIKQQYKIDVRKNSYIPGFTTSEESES